MTEDVKIEEEHKEYLDDLRDSGSVNMMGGAKHLEIEFGLSRTDAKKILMKWMKSF